MGLLRSEASKGGMKVGGIFPNKVSFYEGSLILPTFIPAFEASDKIFGGMAKRRSSSLLEWRAVKCFGSFHKDYAQALPSLRTLPSSRSMVCSVWESDHPETRKNCIQNHGSIYSFRLIACNKGFQNLWITALGHVLRH